MAALNTWTDALYSLNDESFLEIMRNYLGPIKTPFNKPDLIKQLTSFIAQETVKKRIIGLINKQERAIINAVYFLKDPSVDDIYRFFDRKIQFYIVQQLIINLEERLLLLQGPDSSLMLNPILIDDLLGSQIHISHIISLPDPADPVPDFSAGVTVFDQPLFISYLSLCVGNYLRITQEGTLKRSSNRILQEVFPHIEQERASALTHLILRAFTQMGIIQKRDGNYQCSGTNIIDFMEKRSWPDLLCSFIAGCFSPVYPDVDESTIISFIHEFFTILSQIGHLRAKSLQRLWMIQSSHYGLPNHEMHEPLSIMKTLGILDYSGGIYMLNPQARDLFNGDDNLEDHCIIDSDYTITCSRNFSLHASKFLFLCSRIRNTDTNFLFEITKNSTIQAFDEGYQADEIIDLLESLAISHVPHNIVQTIRQWKAEYDSIQIYSGIIISADAHRSRIIEKHPALQEHIIRKFAEGVYLLKGTTETIWREILSQSGVDVLPKTRFSGQPVSQTAEYHPEASKLPGDIARRRFDETVLTDEILPYTFDDSFKKDLEEELQDKRIPKRSYEDLQARIEKGLILLPEQLVSTYLHPTVQEAHGFDYQGKVNLCKQAISNGKDLLEVHVKSFPEKEQILLVEPTELRKQGNELILIGLEVPENHHFEKSLRKIFLLRKLKSSLYSPLQ